MVAPQATWCAGDFCHTVLGSSIPMQISLLRLHAALPTVQTLPWRAARGTIFPATLTHLIPVTTGLSLAAHADPSLGYLATPHAANFPQQPAPRFGVSWTSGILRHNHFQPYTYNILWITSLFHVTVALCTWPSAHHRHAPVPIGRHLYSRASCSTLLSQPWFLWQPLLPRLWGLCTTPALS